MADRQDTAQALADLIREKYEVLKSGDLFALLGIQRDADTDTVKNAYFKLAKVLHPDVIARYDLADLRQAGLEVFKALSEAYNTLSDKKKRYLYAQQLTTGSQPRIERQQRERDSVSEARIFFHKGMLFLQRRVYREAAQCFEQAATLDPSSAKYMCYLGWSLMQDPDIPEDKRLEEARSCFDKALQLGENDHEPHYFMSLYYKAKGDVANQRRSLQDALTINPNHLESKREARLLMMRSKRKTPRSMSDLVHQVSSYLRKIKKKK